MNVRRPKVGDRVAIPNHAVVFFIKNVDETNRTVVAEGSGEFRKVVENIPWKLLTFIDS
jgi:hypothetical protein